MSHARLSPSKAKRWMLCPASVRLEAEAPVVERDTTAADQGTNAHALLEYGVVEGEIPQDLSSFVWPKPEAGIPEELIQQARDCLEYVNRRHEELKPAAVHAEFSADPAPLTGRTDGKGTADVVIASGNFLEIIDLKTGGGYVDASDPQLLIYAAGVLAQYTNEDGTNPFKKVRMTVFQPKRPDANTIERYVEMTSEELLQWVQEVYIPSAVATDDPNAEGVPGEEQCRWCRAAATCEYKSATTEAAMDNLFLPVNGESTQESSLLSSVPVDSMSSEELAKFLDAAPLIEARIKDARARAKKMLENRERVPGFKLVNGRGSRKWSIEDKEELVKKLKNFRLKKSEIFEEVVRSPAKLQKLGLDLSKWEKVRKLIVKTPGALTLVPESDPRADAVPIVSFDPVEQAQELPDFLR